LHAVSDVDEAKCRRAQLQRRRRRRIWRLQTWRRSVVRPNTELQLSSLATRSPTTRYRANALSFPPAT